MDIETMAQKIGLDVESFKELLDLFLETSRSDLAKLHDGLTAGDAQKVAAAAHSIKGASGNMGFSNIYEAARKIESDARTKHLDNTAEDARIIDVELNRLDGGSLRRE